jgi:hypothetical protein
VARVRPFSHLAFVLLLFGAPLRAQQEVTRTQHDSALARALTDLPRETILRVRTTGFPKDGRFQSLERDTLLLATDVELRKIPTATINEVYTRYRQVGRGALIGGATGGVILGVLGIFAVQVFCESPGGCRNDYPTAFFWFGGVGAAGGALIGAGIGALNFGWRRIFP